MDAFAQFLTAHPALKVVLVVAAVGCFWEVVARMRARDQRLLSNRRTADNRGANERAAAIAERVRKSGGTGWPAK